MGDSDDDFDNRRNRDKFRREREDYGRNDRNRNDWNERDRSNPIRRREPNQYPTGAREYPRYSRSPGRYDMSPPPQNKRIRRDWDGPDVPHYEGVPPYFGNPFHHEYPSMHHSGSGGHLNRDSVDYPTQPPMLSFKNFLHDQDENIDQDEAVKRYNDYKIDFKKQQINDFFQAHKDEEWFKHKYHPDEYSKRREEQRQAIKKRLDVFMELYSKGWLDDASVDVENQHNLTRFLDAVVIKMEGGTDHDLKSLDVIQPSSTTNVDNDDDIDEMGMGTKPPDSVGNDKVIKSEGTISATVTPLLQPSAGPSIKEEAHASTPTNVNGTNSKGDNEDHEMKSPKQESKVPKQKRTQAVKKEYRSDGEGSGSEDGAYSDGESDDVNETTSLKSEQTKKNNRPSATSSKDSIDPKASSSQENKEEEPEAGEVPDAPRPLHKTLSIFLRNLSSSTTKEDIENLCKQYTGFRRVCLTDPAPDRKFLRRGWVTFDSNVQIRNICYELNLNKIRDVDTGAIVNRELKNRIRIINGIGQHKTIVRNDLRSATKIIKNLDERWKIWENNSDNTNDKIKTSDDSEISSSTTSTTTKPIGFVSYNPLLKNITEYLVEEGNAEEEELLGGSDSHMHGNPNESTFEIDKELTKVLDRLILYLRVVHSVDYYNAIEYQQEDSMPNRCGIIHARGPQLSTVSTPELNNFMQQFESKLKPFIDYKERIDDDLAKKLGLKIGQDEVDKFINANCQEVAKDKWLCPISGKKFKGPEFVKKHIFNKYQDKIEDVRREVIFFNNYLFDPKRPQLPEHPSTRPPMPPHPSGLPLPTPSLGAPPLLSRPPIWPQITTPAHPVPPHPPPNYHNFPRYQPRPFIYGGGPPGGLPNRRPTNRQLVGYEDLDAPNEMLV